MGRTWSQIVKYAKKTQLGKKAQKMKGKPSLTYNKKKLRRGRDFGSHLIIEKNGKIIGIENVTVSKNVKSRKLRKYIALHELREGMAALRGHKNPHVTALRYSKRDRKYLGIKHKGSHVKLTLDLAGYEFEKK